MIWARVGKGWYVKIIEDQHWCRIKIFVILDSVIWIVTPVMLFMCTS
jgi:hypothetical protein